MFSHMEYGHKFFTPGRYYRQSSTGEVYLCEKSRDSRALLHIANLAAVAPRRILLKENKDYSTEWHLIPAEEDASFHAVYSKDLYAEYGAEVGEEGMIFRRQYHFDPYLDVIGDQELRERLHFVGDNTLKYNAHGSPRMLTEEEGLRGWQRKVEEIIECLRCKERKDFFKSDPTNPNRLILSISHDITKKEVAGLTPPWGCVPALPERTKEKGTMFKFGKAIHLRPMLNEGRIRIFPASYYADSSLNAAQQDGQERRVILRPSKTGFPISVKRNGKEIISSKTHSHGQMAIELGGDQDYFVWCCSKVYEPRLFVDFEADACLLIHDHHEFARRLNKALYAKANFAPGMIANDVRYYDPLCPDEWFQDSLKMRLPVHFLKHFRYMYQEEYRFTWPVMEDKKLIPTDIEVGSLADICDLVEINKPKPAHPVQGVMEESIC